MSEGTTSPLEGERAQMVEEPDFHGCTALVLGAGASAPYGFPIGRQLVEDICQDFPDRFERLDAYGSTSHERRTKAEDFVRTLRASACTSIDEFLADHAMDSEFVRLGKIAIAGSLLPGEDEDRPLRTKDWYEHLIDSWCKKPVKLGVITFNYDRSFEHRFWLALVATFGERCARDVMLIDKTKLINVMYVHGQFGKLPWQALDGNGVPYGTAPGEDLGARVMQAARQLRLMFEPASQWVPGWAGSTLVMASRVFFLGFGYDRRNLARIVPSWYGERLQPDAAIAGTAYGLTPQQVLDVQQVLPQWAGAHWRGRPEILPKTILEAIRETNWLG